MTNQHSVDMWSLNSSDLILLILLCAPSFIVADRSSILDDRERIINDEISMALGGHILLTPDEKLANIILLGKKHEEIDSGYKNADAYSASHHYFKRKAQIEASPVFQMIKTMPKGAALHVHDTALIGGDYLVKNITYRDNLYVCFDESPEAKIHLKFAKSTPPPKEECETFQLMSAVRESYKDAEEFDKKLAEYFTLERDNPEELYPDVDEVWRIFSGVFAAVTPMLTYMPVWKDYMYEALRQYHEDNLLYMEIRSTLPPLYDLDGTTFDQAENLRAIKEVSDRFKKDNPNSLGMKVIYAPNKLVDLEGAKKYVKTVIELKEEFGDFLAGFDMVGQEDKTSSLKTYLPALLEVPEDIKVFYHSGETNWYGTDSDDNLVDAVLLGSKRLGHAYALLKHPVVAEIVKNTPIALEINPLSNQILKLVDDIRNHPASLMVANNYSVVISSDDPGLWGALPMSHDYYEALMAMSSKHAGLEFLKQLAYNSIQFSSLDEAEKQRAVAIFEKQWAKFITDSQNTYQNTLNDDQIEEEKGNMEEEMEEEKTSFLEQREVFGPPHGNNAAIGIKSSIFLSILTTLLYKLIA